MNALDATKESRTFMGKVVSGPAVGLFLLLTPLSDEGLVWDVEFSGPLSLGDQLIDEPMDVRVNLQVDRDFLASFEVLPAGAPTREQIKSLFPKVTRFVGVAP